MSSAESQNVRGVLNRLKEAGGFSSDAVLAESLGVAPNTVSMWIKRDSVPYAAIVSFCESRDLALDWVLLGKGDPSRAAAEPEKKSLPSRNLESVPVVSYMEAGMMTAYEIDRYAHDEMRLDVSAFASSGDRPFGVVVRGASMEPYYYDGDVVLFSAFRTPQVGDDVLVYLQESGESTFKRLDALREQGKSHFQTRLRPLNPLFDTMHVQLERGKDQMYVALASFRKLDRRRRPSTLDIRQPL